MSWEIETYKTSGGQEVVMDFIFKMQPATKGKLSRLLDMLERFGPELTMPHTKPLGDGLYELRGGAGKRCMCSTFLNEETRSTSYTLSKRRARKLQKKN